MFALVLITCLANGMDCHTHVQAEGLQMTQCQVIAPRASAQWQAEHPGRRVVKMICDDALRIPLLLGRGQA